MLDALLVTFREGLEAFLIVAVISAFLRKTNRAGLLRGVRIGLGLSVITCVAGAWLWLQLPNQPIVEGIGALTAAFLVGLLLWQAVRTGRRMKGEIESRLDKVAGGAGEAPSARAIAGVAALTTILVTREGLEAVLYLGIKVFALKAATVGLGAGARPPARGHRQLHVDALRAPPEPGRRPQGDVDLPGRVPRPARHLRRARARRERRHRGQPGVPPGHRDSWGPTERSDTSCRTRCWALRCSMSSGRAARDIYGAHEPPHP